MSDAQPPRTLAAGLAGVPARGDESELAQDLALIELVNRVLDRGVMLRGEVVVSVAGIDLLYLGLDLLLSSVETAEQKRVASIVRSAQRAKERA